METQTEVGKSGTKRRGRKDSDGQEAVMVLEKLSVKVDELVSLYNVQTASATEFGDAIKKVSEDAGLNAATVRKFIVAKAGDDFEKIKARVLQLSLVFEEVA